LDIKPKKNGFLQHLLLLDSFLCISTKHKFLIEVFDKN
jgi:hypothetical protein